MASALASVFVVHPGSNAPPLSRTMTAQWSTVEQAAGIAELEHVSQLEPFHAARQLGAPAPPPLELPALGAPLALPVPPPPELGAPPRPPLELAPPLAAPPLELPAMGAPPLELGTPPLSPPLELSAPPLALSAPA